jgi:hypothetical protein
VGFCMEMPKFAQIMSSNSSAIVLRDLGRTYPHIYFAAREYITSTLVLSFTFIRKETVQLLLIFGGSRPVRDKQRIGKVVRVPQSSIQVQAMT